MDRPRCVGMAWYRSEDYPRLRAMMVGPSSLPANYELWRVSAEQVEATVAASGVEVIRVIVVPAVFDAWCKENGLPPDGTARTRYAMQQSERENAPHR